MKGIIRVIPALFLITIGCSSAKEVSNSKETTTDNTTNTPVKSTQDQSKSSSNNQVRYDR